MSTACYTHAVRLSWQRMKLMLFTPFNLKKWFILGFAAWLATLGEVGRSAFQFNLPPSPDTLASNPEINQYKQQAMQFFNENTTLVLSIAGIILLLITTSFLVTLWASSRGKFVFLHNSIHNSSEITTPWNEYKKEGHSLFFFRILFNIISFCAMAAVAVPIIIIAIPIFQGNAELKQALISLAAFIFIGVSLGAIISFANMLLNDFIIPIMYKKRQNTMDAWVTFFTMKQPFSSYVLYSLFKSMLAAGFVLAFGLAMIATCFFCCIGSIVLALPYLGTVLLLPYYLFMRLYSLYFFQGIDSQWCFIDDQPALSNETP